MLSFEWPWLCVCLPLPWLVWRYYPRYQSHQLALRVPDVNVFLGTDSVVGQQAAQRRGLYLLSFIWFCLVLAVMRPQWLGDAVYLPVSGRDLLVAVDLSGSMREQDMVLNNTYVDRLQASQAIVSEFVLRRPTDRVGLILFGAQAYLQVPLSFDHQTLVTLLKEAVIGLAGKETAIGDAIGLAVKRLQETKVKQKVLILLTDGANTAGSIEPLKAAELAANLGLKIYTIGIGAESMRVSSLFGSQVVNPSADLDEPTLKAIAEKTEGRYFRARDVQELDEIYQLLDELEPSAREQQAFRPQRALFYWPLALAIVLSMLGLMNKVRWS